MKQYKLVDNIFGWVAFIIAAFVYCSTIEPTASFWDCPEFITTAYKQEIGHPPGAPFFMLLGNFFTHFASDTTQVAKMVNTMSALLSAVCIMFLFWTIPHLARKLIIGDWKEMTTGKLIAIEASGMVGALIYTFSDTFWFSAVEGEVYAFSSAFTAVVFWLILKWEDHADALIKKGFYPATRIMSWLDPTNYADTAAQQRNSIWAIGSGQLFGKGLNNSVVTSMKNTNYIIEPQTDFIFAVAGEELGFIGTISIIILLLLIVIECILIARKAKDTSGKLICCGMGALIGFQAFINLCVATGLMPNTGMTLPFVSYGLTSLVSLYMGMGIVLNVGLQPKKYS